MIAVQLVGGSLLVVWEGQPGAGGPSDMDLRDRAGAARLFL